MAGTMFALGVILGVVLTLVVIRGMNRRYVDYLFPIALAVALIVAILSLLTGHGLLAFGAAAVLALGEGVGLVGSAVIGPRVMDALQEHK